MNHVVKRHGHTQPYDERKLYASVFASLNAVRVPVEEAELVANQVCKELGSWLGNKHEVTSGDIHRKASRILSAINPDAGYIYKTHRSIS